MRYILIDYMHLCFKYLTAQPLSTAVKINGVMEIVDTTVPNYTIKDIWRVSQKGSHKVGVFFEGGSEYRKNYFRGKGTCTPEGYKGGREKQGGSFYEGVNLTFNLLQQGKVSVYKSKGHEADDVIYQMVRQIKETDTTTPIDIITNDGDLLPLVDEQVSVYIRGNREHAEDGCPIRKLYYQVTPRTWDEYVSYSSALKGCEIPYNAVLLYKMLKGDPADNIASAVDKIGKVRFNAIMQEMKQMVFFKDVALVGQIKELIQSKEKQVKEDIDVWHTGYEKKDRETVYATFISALHEKETPKKIIALMKKAEKLGVDMVNWLELEDMRQTIGLMGQVAYRVSLGGEEKVREYLEKLSNQYSELKEEIQNILNTPMQEGVPFETIFRYGVSFDVYMRPYLSYWFSAEELERMKFIYGGICLRTLEEGWQLSEMTQPQIGYLNIAVNPLKIQIKS